MPSLDRTVWLIWGEACTRFLLGNWILHASCILAAGLLVSRIPRLSAAMRHALLLGCLVFATVAPVGSLLPSAWQSALPAPATLGVPATLLPSHADRGERRSQVSAVRAAGSRARRAPVEGWGLALLAGWAIVALARALRVAGSARMVARWRSRAVAVHRDRVYAAGGYELLPLRILASPTVRVPMVAGVWAPTVLLPQGLAESLDSRSLGFVLFHEAEHVRRRDPLWFLLAELCLCLLFWHPLAELVRRRMVSAAEDACDERVVRRGRSGTAYVRTLLAVLEQSSPLAAGTAVCPLGAEGGELTRRVVRILGGVPRPSLGAALLAGAATLASAAGTSLLQFGSRPAVPRAAPTASHRNDPARRRVVFASYQPRPVRPGGSPKALPVTLAPAHSRPLSRLAGISPSATASPEFLSPEVAITSAPVGYREQEPRDHHCVVFVIDVASGEWADQERMRARVLQRIEGLAPSDRFNVVRVETGAQAFSGYPVTPSEDRRAAVRAWLSEPPTSAGGSVGVALQQALGMPDVSSVVLFSDRLVGGAERSTLAAIVDRENPSHAQVVAYTFPPRSLDPEVVPSGAPVPGAAAPGKGLEAGEAETDLRP